MHVPVKNMYRVFLRNDMLTLLLWVKFLRYNFYSRRLIITTFHITPHHISTQVIAY